MEILAILNNPYVSGTIINLVFYIFTTYRISIKIHKKKK